MSEERTGIAPQPEPYEVSDERLVEIRNLIYVSPADYVSARPGVTTHQLVAAVYDLLSERDDRV